MIIINETPGGMAHTSAFVGPTNHTLHLYVDVSTLTTAEVDSQGCLKPNVPFRIDGKLLTGGVGSGAAAVAASGNTGNGTVTGIAGKSAGKNEVITLKALSNTTFSVVGSRSGRLANATVGTPYVSTTLNFTLTAGGNAFAAGDEFQIVLTADVKEYVYGVTVESTQIVKPNPTNVSLAASNVKAPVAVATQGQINRSIARDVLGREYSPAELAGFAAPGCHFTLTPANV